MLLRQAIKVFPHLLVFIHEIKWTIVADKTEAHMLYVSWLQATDLISIAEVTVENKKLKFKSPNNHQFCIQEFLSLFWSFPISLFHLLYVAISMLRRPEKLHLQEEGKIAKPLSAEPVDIVFLELH